MDRELSPKVPVHLAVIMDGNGRWAEKRGLSRSAGHRAGVEALRRVIRYCGDRGVKELSLYAFSTENWVRPPAEVAVLMNLLVEYFDSEIAELDREGACIRVTGSRDGLSKRVLSSIENAEKRTRGNGGIILNICFNYGGRDEIVRAAARLAEMAAAGRIDPAQIDEIAFRACLMAGDLPDPDLVVRTSGEKRLSNFLPFQSAYAEFCFPEILWPDVNEEEIENWFRDYASRDRRYGGLSGLNREGDKNA